MSALRDAARLLAYFGATILTGTLLAPPLFWGARILARHGWAAGLGRYDFETFFHRALLLAALALLWPLLRSLRVKRPADLALRKNVRWARDLGIGFLIAAIPLALAAGGLLIAGVYRLRHGFPLGPLAAVVGSAIVVPIIEETLFRGLILGVLLRLRRPRLAMVLSAAIFSILHFLKAPEHTSVVPNWLSGFTSLAHAFSQFADPMLVLAAFTTLFLLGLILADARVRTSSLWCPIGLHAGWILTNGVFNKLAHREVLALPWIGRNLLVGIIPLLVALVSWAILHGWLRQNRERA